jgi:hypothetical protein
MLKMTPLDDPRPFAEVLRDFLARHNLRQTPETAAIFDAGRSTLTDWLAARQTPRGERSHRALMTLIDEGRA